MLPPGMDTRLCARCSRPKPVREFRVLARARSSSGMGRLCEQCRLAEAIRRREKEIAEYKRKLNFLQAAERLEEDRRRAWEDRAAKAAGE